MIIVTRAFQIITLVFSISAIYLSSTHLPSFIDKIKKERDEARFQMEKSNEELARARRDFVTIEISKNNEKKALEMAKKTQELLVEKDLLCKNLSRTVGFLEASNQKLMSDLKFQTSQNHALRSILPVTPTVTISPPSIIRKK